MSAAVYPGALSYVRNVRRWLREAGPSEVRVGMDWYSHAAGEVQHRIAEPHGLPFGRACGIVAVLSPMVRWERNLLEAENVIHGRRSAAYPANVRKAAYILAGDDPEEVVKGPKVTAFYRLLLSGGRDTKHVCVDSIAILAALGIDPNPLVSSDDVAHVFDRPAQLRAIREAYRSAASWAGMLPNQAQAIVWTTWRNERDKA